MSYKYTILQDHPLSFYLLDEIQSGNNGLYSDLIQKYATYQDLKDNGVSYAAVSGLPILDYSGNGLDGYGVNASSKEIMPIIGAGVRGTEINEFTQIRLKSNGIATNSNPDSPFSLECWFKPDSLDINEYPVLADSNNNIGIFYKNENIIFKVNSNNYINYKISKNQAMHVVGVFCNNKISLYVNGKLVNEKTFTNKFKFINETFLLNLGPANNGNKFIIDGVATYTHELSSDRVLLHYNAGLKETKYSQIVYSKNGILFSLNSTTIKPSVSYRYPGVNTLEKYSSGDSYFDPINKRLTFYKTTNPETKLFSFTDRVYVLSSDKITSSQLRYGQDVENIIVEVSVPGQPWVVCKNNSPLPYYNKNDNLYNDILDIRVTMTTTDSSYDIPYLDFLEIDMYIDKDFYSDNSSFKIYSDYDYSIGQYNYPIRMQNIYNGISMFNGHGFSTDIDIDPFTIEMIFAPDGESNILLSTSNSEFKWDINGDVYSNGIKSIYVNGINRTLETNINDIFLNGIFHHIIIVLDSPGSNIKFNQNQAGDQYGQSNSYSNIAFYKDEFLEQDVAKNYKLYCSDNSMSINAGIINISEDSNGIDNTPNYIRYFDNILTTY